MKYVFRLILGGVLLGVSGSAYAFAPGDLNCDGAVNGYDIDPFVLALTNPEGYAETFPFCDLLLADTNGDGLVNGYDIGPFVQLLIGGPSEIIPAQLAGNSLELYPYFEYVKAFNQNAAIKLAIDPTQHADIIGHTADVYIVEHKSAGAWQVDPELIDVTADGALTVTFGGSTIQDNTFQVSGPNELNASVFDPGTGDFTGLGHAYDLVVDFDRDGQLDDGDYIDGLGREAGLYVVHDTSALGPLAVTDVPPYSVGAVFGIPASDTNEVLYYPTNIASMTPRPLVVVGHGGGHNYTWYDHIGHHLASYGYIVMSHQNGPGIPDETRGHTDAFLDQQDQIAGGALNGKIDASRIIWIGHSLGGMGVVAAVDSIVDREYIPTHYTLDSIVLVSAMLPNAMGATDEATPHHTNFHLWTAAGDTDISGFPTYDQLQTFLLHDRATGYRMSTIVQGTGHAWFHNGPAEPSWFDGPCPLNQTIVHQIQLGLFLPLIKYFAEGNIAASDFLWRQYERFHPMGVDTSNPCIVVSNEYRNGAAEGNFFIDDYQTGTALDISSSGGAVSYTVQDVVEGVLKDRDGTFSWSASDPFNGATHAWNPEDTSRGVTFDWNGDDRYYEWEVVPAARDVSNYLYLSFRGAQTTHHPYTMAALGDLTFTVMLRDAAGVTSSINIGASGGGLEEPYQRGGGHHDEFEVVRIRTTDFLTNASGLDLRDVVAVRFSFGPDWGSNEGRIVLDELMLTNDYPPGFTPLGMTLAGSSPEFMAPHVPTELSVEIAERDDALVADSAMLHYRYDGGTWRSAALERIGGELWRGTLTPQCGDAPEYYFSARGESTGMVYVPAGGPRDPLASYVGNYLAVLVDDFQSDLGWSVQSDLCLTSGAWQRAVPGGWTDGSPPGDFDGSGWCYVTENRANYDVDGGPAWLTSPLLDLSAADNPVLRFAEWFTCDDSAPPAQDFLDVFVTSDDGATWAQMAHIASHTEWAAHDIYLGDYVPLTATVRVRFSVQDVPNNSRTEAGIDAVQVFDVQCD
jgi:hypothetical protein